MVDLNWAYCPPVDRPCNLRQLKGWALGHVWDIYLDVSPTSPTILTGGENVKKLSLFLDRIRVKSSNDYIIIPEIWGRSVHPTLRLRG